VSGGRYALIVANGDYDDPKLRQLRAPAADAQALARVLGDPEIGGFEVSLVTDEPDHILKRKVNRFLANRRRDDTLLLHFSCHGLKDDSGRLFFAARDTEVDYLHGSAMGSDWLRERIEDSRSAKIVLLLDCCYSGAFSGGRVHRAGAAAHATELLEGNGRVVLTASSALEFAWEGDTLSGVPAPSVFTAALVDGLETGEADRDQDRLVGIGELYEYICDWIKREGAPQRPHMDSRVQGELVIARNPHVRARPLDDDVLRLLESPVADVRLLAVPMLASVIARGDGQALTARDVLERLIDDDSIRVQRAAREVLRAAPAPAEATPPAAPDPPDPVTPPAAATPPLPEWRATASLAHDDAVMAVALGPDGLVATASRDHTARLWGADGSERRRFAHDDWVIAVAVSADGRRVATTCRDLTARVWDAASGAEVARLPLGAMPWAVALDAGGALLTAGCADGTVRVWDVAAGCERACLTHETGVVAVAFDHDGAVLATAVRDTAMTWDPAGRELGRADTPGGPIMAVGFGPDRRLLAASAGHDGIARVWEIASGLELARVEHLDVASAVAFDADVRRVATAARDGTARVWALA
jgi:hypothetical protein